MLYDWRWLERWLTCTLEEIVHHRLVVLGENSKKSPTVFKINPNASKPSEHPPSGGKMSKGLGGNIGCRVFSRNNLL